MKNDVSD